MTALVLTNILKKVNMGNPIPKAIGGGSLGASCVVGLGLDLPWFYLIAPVGELLMSPQKFASLYVLDLFLYHGIPFLYHTHSLAMIQNYLILINVIICKYLKLLKR